MRSEDPAAVAPRRILKACKEATGKEEAMFDVARREVCRLKYPNGGSVDGSRGLLQCVSVAKAILLIRQLAGFGHLAL